jgi:hexaprenyl-diphosphate synthase
VHQSSAIARTKELAMEYVSEAKSVLRELPGSEARDALEVLAERVIGRKS